MNHEMLQQPMANAYGRVGSWWQDRVSSRKLAAASNGADRDALIAVQWLVTIGTSYLVFAVHDRYVTDPLAVLLIMVCLISAPVLQRLPERIFDTRLITPGLLVLDSILIVFAMALSEQPPWDLFLLFFFCVFIAAIGENLIQIAVGCVLLSLVFLMFVSPHAVDLSALNPNFLIRVPFMFSISIFYGYMAGQVKHEKKRLENMEEAVRLRRQFVCALAHDVKTPLNVILGHAELLARANGGKQDAKLSSVKCIRDNIDHIVQLITDFLAISKLETFKLESARNLLQMNAIAEGVVMQQMVTARDKNLNLTVDLDKDLSPILGDDDQLQRALANLVGNAIKFTPRGGSITVTSRMVKNDICIKVTDTGPGIPKEELAGLFCEFKRLTGTANIEGTGLGLFIVKTIVEAHGGTVAAESENGLGTTLTVVLPAAKHSFGAVQPEHRRNKTATPPSLERARMARHVVEPHEHLRT